MDAGTAVVVDSARGVMSVLYLCGDVYVRAGALTANGAVTLGDADTDAITVKGTTTFNEAVTADKTVTVTGEARAEGVTRGGGLRMSEPNVWWWWWWLWWLVAGGA